MNDLMPMLSDDAHGTLARLVASLSIDTAAGFSTEAAPRPIPRRPPTSERIMIVDDEPINVKIARKLLEQGGYSDFVVTSVAEDALELIRREKPGVVLLDVMMPGISGLEILGQMRLDPALIDLPVIILTADTDRQTRIDAIERGATDFLAKPVDATELIPRVRNALVLKAHQDHLRNYARELEIEVAARTAALQAAQDEIIHCLARAAEYRDDDTGRHIRRVGRYSEIIARELKLPATQVQLIADASPLHDIGKIGVADSILLKPGRLDPAEREAMQKHCGFGKRIADADMSEKELNAYRAHADLGARLLTSGSSPVLRMAARIALTHHERWDGSGSPLGLAGADIPLESRITAVADVFDALSSKRPYKPAFPIDRCFEMMAEERGRHFDPQVLDAFMARRQEIVEIQCYLADVE